MTRKWGDRALVPAADSRAYSADFLSRSCRLKQVVQEGLLGGNANRETLAPFGATTLDHQTTVLGCHTNQEAVGPLTGNIARLKCSFHDHAP